MNKIEKARERRKYLKGDIHTKGLSNLEKQRQSPLVEVQDPITGRVYPMRKCVSDMMKYKGDVKTPSKTYSAPDLSHIDWSR